MNRNEQIRFAIYCSQAVLPKSSEAWVMEWSKWADAWLSNTDRATPYGTYSRTYDRYALAMISDTSNADAIFAAAAAIYSALATTTDHHVMEFSLPDVVRSAQRASPELDTRALMDRAIEDELLSCATASTPEKKG